VQRCNVLYLNCISIHMYRNITYICRHSYLYIYKDAYLCTYIYSDKSTDIFILGSAINKDEVKDFKKPKLLEGIPSKGIYKYIYIYIYIYIHTCVHICGYLNILSTYICIEIRMFQHIFIVISALCI
jgi:hypothetical protein